jgi:hypothetical protein
VVPGAADSSRAGLDVCAPPVGAEAAEAPNGATVCSLVGFASNTLVCPRACCALKRCLLFVRDPGISPCLRVLMIRTLPGLVCCKVRLASGPCVNESSDGFGWEMHEVLAVVLTFAVRVLLDPWGASRASSGSESEES